MKKTWKTVLLFAAVLAALLAVWALAERFRPAEEPVEEAPEETPVVANAMDEAGATAIVLSGDRAGVTGLGAEADGSAVTIVYPGTYRISGTLENGQLVVDCGDYHGAVYLILEGASVSCDSGPALYVKQSDKTVIHLAAGTENALRDGADYVIAEGQEEKSGGGVYSADDLFIQGEGSLTVVGTGADGIRSKDGLTVSGGTLTVYSADDALQGSDYVAVESGNISLHAYGDGIHTTEGYVALSGGEVRVASAGDGVSAAAELTVSGGALSVIAYGGADNYETAALNDISAKGLKGTDISITGGAVVLDTADDGVHGQRSVAVSGGSLVIRSGDDGIHGALTVDISGGEVTVSQSYEALEAGLVRVRGGRVTALAESNGVDAGEDGFVITGGTVALRAPRCVSSEGAFAVESGWLQLAADGTDSPLKFPEGGVTGGTVVLCANGTEAEILEDGALPSSILYMFPAALPAGTAVTLRDAAGETVLTFETAAACAGVLVASGAMGLGQRYTLSAGEYAGAAELAEGCAVAAAE